LGVEVGIKRGESEGGGIEGIGRGQRDNGPLSNKRTAIGEIQRLWRSEEELITIKKERE
jgi:hypothetical protein